VRPTFRERLRGGTREIPDAAPRRTYGQAYLTMVIRSAAGGAIGLAALEFAAR
jgi:hypothetical protein